MLGVDVMRIVFAAGVLAVLPAVVAVHTQPNPYDRVETGLKLPTGFAWSTVAAVVPDSQDHLWVMQRGTPPILEFDRSGNLLKSMGDGQFALPHGLTFDRDGNIWAVDSGPFTERGRMEGKGFQVFKMDRNGKILLTLGKPNVAQAGPDTFLGPTGVAVSENGDVFISDGHTPRPGQQDGDRVVKFSKDGKFLQAWGRRGADRGELKGPHGIVIDRRGRVLVADRDNHRIQLFDQSGNYLGHWMHYARPSGIWIDDDDMLYVAHNADSDKTLVGWPFGIRIGSAKDGTLTGLISDLENEVVGGDHHGAIYSGGAKELLKFVRK
jgi:DNA-binding beta-propeller fold protein YncE